MSFHRQGQLADRSRITLERPNRVLGILAAVLAAWALLVPLPFFVFAADHLWWEPSWSRAQPFPWPSFGGTVLWIFLAAMVGLPLSLMFCFFGGYPAWRLATRLGMKRRRDAMIVGALLGAVLALALAVLRVEIGIGQLSAKHEPLSRIVFLYPGVFFYVVAVGVVAGLAAWRAAGKKSDTHQEMARVFA